MLTKRFHILLAATCLAPAVLSQQASPAGDCPFSLKGYLKEMPAVQVDKKFSGITFFNLIHNRMNMRANWNENLHAAGEVRTRLFTNEQFRDYPYVRQLFEKDHGLVDLSWVWIHEGAWLGHTEVDRLYIDWRAKNWQVRAGRQRINWGINLVSNPNDLFNTYSFFDFDYAERPGTDAIRIQRFVGSMARIQFAVSPARKAGETVAAAMINLNKQNYDLQALAGYYRNRLALGTGWAGHIGIAGFKGEATWFFDLDHTEGQKPGNLVASIGLDHMFGNGTFGVVELLYNGGHRRTGTDVLMITQPLQPDNILFSEFAVTLSAQHPFSAILQGALSVMTLPDIEAIFLMPGITWSVITNLDLQLLAQAFTGGKESVLGDAGTSIFLSLQYSF